MQTAGMEGEAMPRIRRFCATPTCGERATRGCVRCGASCCKKHGKLYPVELDHFPPTLPAALKEELQAYGATASDLVLCPACLQVVMTGRVDE